MQVLPGTWTWVQQRLAGQRARSELGDRQRKRRRLYLAQLIRDSGGDEALAAAFYYQGEGSVRAVGMLPETQRYVANVTALRSRFGG